MKTTKTWRIDHSPRAVNHLAKLLWSLISNEKKNPFYPFATLLPFTFFSLFICLLRFIGVINPEVLCWKKGKHWKRPTLLFCWWFFDISIYALSGLRCVSLPRLSLQIRGEKRYTKVFASLECSDSWRPDFHSCESDVRMHRKLRSKASFNIFFYHFATILFFTLFLFFLPSSFFFCLLLVLNNSRTLRCFIDYDGGQTRKLRFATAVSTTGATVAVDESRCRVRDLCVRERK